MGKQINYYMEYESFVHIAEKALEMGCEIIKRDEKANKIIRSTSADIITRDCRNYHFHIPEAGEFAVKTTPDGLKYVDSGYSASGAALIEAGYSYINTEEKRISRNRLYCISGYYDENESLVKRPDCVTKIYNSLARFVKKLAPAVDDRGNYNYKEYATPYCLELKKNGYILR